jgi:hypothetical protein
MFYVEQTNGVKYRILHSVIKSEARISKSETNPKYK